MNDVRLLDISENSKPSLWWNQTADHLLSNILGRCAEKILQLDGAEFLNDGRLLLYAVLEPRFKFIQLTLLLVKILNQPPTSFLHLVQTTLQPYPVRCLVSLTVLDFVIGYRVL